MNPEMSGGPCRDSLRPKSFRRNPPRVVSDVIAAKEETDGVVVGLNHGGRVRWDVRVKAITPEAGLYVCGKSFRTPKCGADPDRTPQDPTLSEGTY